MIKTAITVLVLAILATGGFAESWIQPSSEGSPATAAGAPSPALQPVQPVPAMTQPLSPESSGKGMAAIARAASLGRYLFVFFHSGQNEQTTSMWSVFQGAMAKMQAQADSVAVLVTDPLEQPLVQRFGVDRAPMPLVLVLAPNGAIMAGFPNRFEEAQLLNAFGTPGMEQTLKALQDRRLVLVCIQNAATQQNDAAMYGVNELKADPQVGGAVITVFVNPADPNEGKFFGQLQIDPTLSVAQTVMLAPPGTPVGKFMGGTTKTMLLSKLQASGGCGPGGCAGGKCGPPATAAAAAAAPPPQASGFMAKVKSAFGK